MVMLIVLHERMRHQEIATTIANYVGDNAVATADTGWNAAATSSGANQKASTDADGESALKTSGDDRS